MVRLDRLLLVLLLAIGSAVPVAAQLTKFDLSGTVNDATGAVLPGVTMTLKNLDTGLVRTTVTDAEGRYSFNSMPPTGKWTLTTELQDFKTQVRDGLEFQANTKPEVNFRMELGSVSEVITVEAAAPLVRTRESELSKIMDDKAVSELPTSGRNFMSLLQTSGAVVPTGATATSTSISVNGQGTRNANFVADGVSITGREIRSVNGEFGGGSTFSLDVIKELQVITSGFKAETGQTGTGTISVITKSGTNTLGGSLYGVWRPSDLVAANLLTNQRTTQKRQQYGGTIGGPIVKDKTHYFGNFEATKIDDTSIVTSVLEPGCSATSGCAHARPEHQYQGFGKLNGRLSDVHLFEARYSFNRNKQQGQGVGGLTTYDRRTNTDARNDTLVTSLVSTIGTNKVNEVRFRYTYDVVDFYSPLTAPNGPASRTPDFSTVDVSISRPGIGNAGPNPSYPQNLVEKRAQWVDSFTIIRGPHQVKVGADLIASWRFVTFFNNFSGTYTFATGTPYPYDQANPATYPFQYTQGFGNSGLNFTDQMIGVFAQDDWQLRRGVTLNLGVRWDKDTLFQGFNRGIAPRLGFAYNVGNQGRTVIRANSGIFYDTLESSLVNRESNFGPSGQFQIDLRQGDPLFPAFPNRFNSLPSGAGTVPRATVYLPIYKGDKFPSSVDSYQRTAPHYFNTNAGFQRQLTQDWAFSVDYARVRGINLLTTLDINSAPFFALGTGQTRTAAQANLQRPLGVPNTTGGQWGVPFTGFRSIYLQGNGGATRYDAIRLSLMKRFSDHYQWQINYSYGKSRGDAEQFRLESSYVPGLTDPDGDRSFQDAVLSTDTPHVFVTSGVYEAPYGIRIGGILFARSGFPYTGVVGFDADGDGFSDTGSFGDRPVSLKRNSFRRPVFVQLDLSLAYTLRLPKAHNVEVRLDVFNLPNRTNITGVNNIIGLNPANPPAAFGTTTGVGRQREAQLGLRWSF
jgi:hypothetical protein